MLKNYLMYNILLCDEYCMFRQLRRIKQKLSEEECQEILFRQPRGFLSVWGDNEYPYVLPMNYVYSNNKVYFHSALDGHKIDSIRKHEKVSFSVIDNGEKVDNEWYYIFKSVICFGKIRIIDESDEKYNILTILGNKYFPSEEYTKNEIDNAANRTIVLELDIEHMSGKIVTEK